MFARRNPALYAWLFSLLVVAVACSEQRDSSIDELGSATTPATDVVVAPPTCNDEELFCVGVVVAPGGVAMDVIQPALDRLTDRLDAQVSVTYAADGSKFEILIGTMIDRDVDVIITTGGGAGAAAVAAGERHPNVELISLGQPASAAPDNVHVISSSSEEAGFLAGALAALTTNTGIVGAVLATDSDPDLEAFRHGVEQGVLYIRPGGQLVAVHHPGGLAESFFDETWASTSTGVMVTDGVDVVIGAGGPMATAALSKSASLEGVACIAFGSPEESSPSPGCMVGRVINTVGLDRALFDLVSAVHAGTFDATEVGVSGFDVIDLAGVSDDVVERMDTIRRGLADGSIGS